MTAEASTIVKFAGGKGRLLPHLVEVVPRRVRTYVEPFAGGAALFFRLMTEEARGERRVDHAVLSDTNEDLIVTYQVVKTQVEALIQELSTGDYGNTEPRFYEVRSIDPLTLLPVQRAARLIYLNKTCFNGLWRVNADGKFNTPFGRYTNPTICDADALRAASRALERATILHCDFAQPLASLMRGDFAYLDPPYVPLSATSSFTAYAVGGFDLDEHRRLAKAFRGLEARGVAAALSNADTPEARSLYGGLAMRSLSAARAIAANGARRGAVREILVTTAPQR